MILIAGATGTTGSRIATRLVEQGFPILLGARNPARLEALARELGVGDSAKRIMDLSTSGGVERALKDVTVVVNTTSPAASSALTLARAVTDRGLAYTDISGDVATTRTLLERLGPQARASRATLSPGAGFAPYCGITAVMLGREALPRARRVKIWYASPGFKQVIDGTRSCLITLEAPPIYQGTATSCASVAARLYRRPSLFGFVPPPFLFESGAAAANAGALKLLHTAH